MQITGIIGAMDVEVAILRSIMKNARTETVSGIDFIIGSLEGRRVVLARSGVGKVFAALCAQTMILKFGVTEIVNSGVAGTLTPELHIGDVAISTACVQHDMDTSAVGDPVGLISGINMIELPADTKIADELDRVCAAANVNHRLGVIASGDQFVHTTERRGHRPGLLRQQDPVCRHPRHLRRGQRRRQDRLHDLREGCRRNVLRHRAQVAARPRLIKAEARQSKGCRKNNSIPFFHFEFMPTRNACPSRHDVNIAIAQSWQQCPWTKEKGDPCHLLSMPACPRILSARPIRRSA